MRRVLGCVASPFIHEDEVDTPQGRRRSPRDSRVRSRPLVVQYPLNGVDAHVLDTVHIRELGLILVHQILLAVLEKKKHTHVYVGTFKCVWVCVYGMNLNVVDMFNYILVHLGMFR